MIVEYRIADEGSKKWPEVDAIRQIRMTQGHRFRCNVLADK